MAFRLFGGAGAAPSPAAVPHSRTFAHRHRSRDATSVAVVAGAAGDDSDDSDVQFLDSADDAPSTPPLVPTMQPSLQQHQVFRTNTLQPSEVSPLVPTAPPPQPQQPASSMLGTMSRSTSGAIYGSAASESISGAKSPTAAARGVSPVHASKPETPTGGFQRVNSGGSNGGVVGGVGAFGGQLMLLGSSASNGRRLSQPLQGSYSASATAFDPPPPSPPPPPPPAAKRIVVLGAPGTGKSSFVNAFRQATSAGTRWERAPVGRVGRNSSAIVAHYFNTPAKHTSPLSSTSVRDGPQSPAIANAAPRLQLPPGVGQDDGGSDTQPYPAAGRQQQQQQHGALTTTTSTSSATTALGGAATVTTTNGVRSTLRQHRADAARGRPMAAPTWQFIDCPGRVLRDIGRENSEGSRMLRVMAQGLPHGTPLAGRGACTLEQLETLQQRLRQQPNHHAVDHVVLVVKSTDLATVHRGWVRSRLADATTATSTLDYVADMIDIVHHELEGRVPHVVVTHLDAFSAGAERESAQAYIRRQLSTCCPHANMHFVSLPQKVTPAAGGPHVDPASPKGVAVPQLAAATTTTTPRRVGQPQQPGSGGVGGLSAAAAADGHASVASVGSILVDHVTHAVLVALHGVLSTEVSAHRRRLERNGGLSSAAAVRMLLQDPAPSSGHFPPTV